MVTSVPYETASRPLFAAGELVAVLTTQPLDRLLDYKAPEGGVGLGDYVIVPLGPRLVLGVVWGEGAGDYDRSKIRAINRILPLAPMQPHMVQFLERAADYTLSPLPAMLRLATRMPGIADAPGTRKVLRLADAMPDRMTKARERAIAVMEEHGGLGLGPGELAVLAGVSGSVVKGLVAQGVLIEEKVERDAPFAPIDHTAPGKALSADQEAASAALRAAIASGRYGTTLLKGVTGSGKTEVYLEAVAACLASGRQALVLLPEIALTGEFIDRVEARFGARPAEWHSGVTQAERRRTWRAVADRTAQFVVGARSALFLPFQSIGLIVVDEEHDSSYKQEDSTLYHARDMAVLRASISGAQVILASATPSLESWANAEAGKYSRLDLNERFGAAVMPKMLPIDMREDRPPKGFWMAETLVTAVEERIAAGEQALLFLNRRGYAPLTQCRACGHQIECTDCDARMVEHRFLARLICHQCGANRPMPEACPSCAALDSLSAIGPGVERLAEEAEARFPGARIAILSSDLADSARKLKARIQEIANGAADIIIGTQMVAKGHNFPLLTLVGVIDADLGLNGGEMRAAEKCFQLIRQVAGRAGRVEAQGTALLQTYQPEHPVMQAILSGDDEEFWRTEAAQRQDAGSPPFGRMAGIVVSGENEAQVYDLAGHLARNARAITDAGAQLFGPAAAPIARIRGRHRVRLLIKSPKGCALQPAIRAWLGPVNIPTQIRLTVDIDPHTFY